MYKHSIARKVRHAVLPNEPRIIDAQRQAALTASYLQPWLTELEIFFLTVRARIDEKLLPLCPYKLGKPYPLGQCLEISLEAQQMLKAIDPAMLDSPAAQAGHRAFLAFRRAGGTLRQVWGDLRGEFFQNAFQLGSLYVDVSNDTVTPTKPKVEILPFVDARFIPIRDFQHFSRIAQRYWKVEVYPNHVLPEIAPYCPLIYRRNDGALMLAEASSYMLALTWAGGFRPSEEVLAQGELPLALFQQVSAALAGHGELAADPASGRMRALAACRTLRRSVHENSMHRLNHMLQKVGRLNQLLFTATQATPICILDEKVMDQSENLTIDGKQYPLAALSEAARQQLQMLRMSEQRAQELQRDLAITQTARYAYLQALKNLLPQT
ncbi:hypothetical protein [Duganella fentianensis]|uniref:hypothetical protein n=1 Tax=Duganella fentianensis TaxID=2692177 RepID=UPI0032B16865